MEELPRLLCCWVKWRKVFMVIEANLVITFAGLQGAIVPALESVDIELIGKYFRKARDYDII